MISAKIIADSISPQGIRMTTMEIEYPRFILAELNTHRMLSKNSASSRAIPVKTMHEQINTAPATPVYWGKNQAGMQAKETLTGSDLSMAKYLWGKAKEDALHWAAAMAGLELHKQIANRITEPWMTMKTVISGTEWANLFWLRCHKDAQPEFRELAVKMHEAMQASEPQKLNPGEWHLPYVKQAWLSSGEQIFLDNQGDPITLADAKMISASCCAQVSYRKNDDTLEKATKIYRQLIESTPAHASPVEHQATPIDPKEEYWEDTAGVSHCDRQGQLWSGNLRGWIQLRKTIPSESVWGQIV